MLDFTELPVFPVDPDTKAPLVQHWREESKPGFVREGEGVALDCGKARKVVIDLDRHGDEDGLQTWEQLKRDLGFDDADAVINETPTAGGRHIIFQDTSGGRIGNSAGKLGKGVDVRANGGYVLVPPTPGYRTLQSNGRAPGPLPEALKDYLLGPQVPLDQLVESEDAAFVVPEDVPADAIDYVRPICNKYLTQLAEAEKGTRNETLNKVTFALAGYAWTRLFDKQDLMAKAIEACERNGLIEDDGVETFLPSFESGWSSGVKHPRPLKQLEDDAGYKMKGEIPKWASKRAPVYPDFVRALKALGYTFELNITTDQIYVNGEKMSDVDRSRILSQLDQYGYRRKGAIVDGFVRYAEESCYHPVKRYLEREVGAWDGEDHIAKLCSYIEDKDGNFPLFFRKWLIGAVARAYEKHSTQNRMLVIEGPQGIGKSYFVRWLASGLQDPELFIEGPINPSDKDYYVRLARTWIWEVSELGSTTRRSDRESLKYFLSTQKVTVRKAYGREDIDKPALSSFIGTVNFASGLFDDPTGYRRFMPTSLTHMEWDYAEDVDVDQVWAQAKALYDQGESWVLTAEEGERAHEAAVRYEVDDPLVDIIAQNVEYTGKASDGILSQVLWAKIRKHTEWTLGRKPRSEMMEIAEVMKKLFGTKDGFDKPANKITVDGERGRGYVGVKWSGPSLQCGETEVW